MNFEPYLFIGIGEKNCYFTLRECYVHEYYVGRTRHTEIRSFHHKNLSQDPDEAMTKALDFAAKLGVVLKTSRASMVEEMNEIKRATAEQLAERRDRAAEQFARWERERADELAWQRAEIARGVWPFGRRMGTAFADLDRGFATWLIEKREEFDGMMRECADAIATNWAHLALPKPSSQEKLGVIGGKIEVTATVTFIFDGDSYYGPYTITSLVAETGESIAIKGKFKSRVGEVVRIAGTVKDHSEYRGWMQTSLNRVKRLELPA